MADSSDIKDQTDPAAHAFKLENLHATRFERTAFSTKRDRAACVRSDGTGLRKQRSCTATLVNFVGIMEHMDEQILPAVSRWMGCSFHATPLQIGSISFGRALVQALASPFSGIAGHCYCRIRVLFVGCLVWGICTCLFSTSTSIHQGGAFWALNGIGLSLIIPNSQSLIADYYTEGSRGTAFGTLWLTGALGGMLGAVYATAIGDLTVAGMAGWRFAFVSVGMVSIAIGLIMLAYGSDPRGLGVWDPSLLLEGYTQRAGNTDKEQSPLLLHSLDALDTRRNDLSTMSPDMEATAAFSSHGVYKGAHKVTQPHKELVKLRKGFAEPHIALTSHKGHEVEQQVSWLWRVLKALRGTASSWAASSGRPLPPLWPHSRPRGFLRLEGNAEAEAEADAEAEVGPKVPLVPLGTSSTSQHARALKIDDLVSGGSYFEAYNEGGGFGRLGLHQLELEHEAEHGQVPELTPMRCEMARFDNVALASPGGESSETAESYDPLAQDIGQPSSHCVVYPDYAPFAADHDLYTNLQPLYDHGAELLEIELEPLNSGHHDTPLNQQPHQGNQKWQGQQAWPTGAGAAHGLLKAVKHVITIPTFVIIIVQGIIGSTPGKALVFLTLYLQLVGMSDATAGLLMAINIFGAALGGLLGGWLGDQLAQRYPHHGRIFLAQFSVCVNIPLTVIIFKGMPMEATSNAVGQYATILFVYGIITTWPAPGCNNPIFAEIVPPHMRNLVYAFDRSFEGAVSAIGAPLVGLFAEKYFGFHGTATTRGCLPSVKATRGSAGGQAGSGAVLPASDVHHDNDTKAVALGDAMLFWLVVPNLVCVLCYSGLHWSYRRDKVKAQACGHE